jgi:4-hydroxybenzoate polyprenyltransferase
VNLLPKEINGNGSLGTTGALMLALVLVAVVVYFVANELVAWVGVLILALVVIYGMKATRTRRVGGFHTRY